MSDPGAVVREVLGPGGELAARLPDFEHRPGQVALGEAVAEVIEAGGTLLAEAGTGVGKTLAYLVPAVACGQKVVVSTATRPLQAQLLEKDVPLLEAALGRPLRVVAMKGRRNYLCLHRLDTRAPPADLEQAAAWAHVAEWVEVSEAGDRAELAGIPEGSPIWSALTVGSESCLGSRCPRYGDCFVTRARARARAADLVVVNHHLYFADLAVRAEGGAALPDHEVAIFDEAHAVPEVAALFFGRAISDARLAQWSGDAGRAVARLSTAPPRLPIALEAVLEATRSFIEGLRPSGGARLAWDPGDVHPALATAWLTLDAALDEAAGALASVAREDEEIGGLVRRATALRRILASFFEASGDDEAVWYREGRGARGASLAMQPVDPAAVLGPALFDRLRATVFVSATMAPAGDFEFLRRRLGAPEDARAEVFASPFDYTTQARLYLPPDLPDPRHPAFPDAVAAVVHGLTAITEGRAFVLFTSLRNLDAVHQRLRGRLPWPLMRQGEAPRARLLQRFRETPGAVLLATASFWEGVDVPGDALSLVIIDKLPFTPPDDPVLQARIAIARSRGEAPFRTVQIPEAALALRQGFGRLIRTGVDRGIVAILDQRLHRRGYGQLLLRALPPAPRLTDLEALRSWWAGSL